MYIMGFLSIVSRSLTKRQRELLQAYADDVEGRAPSNSAYKENAVDVEGRASSNSTYKENPNNVEGQGPQNPTYKETEPDASRSTSNNGRASFAHSFPITNETWLSRTWKNVKALLGL